MYEKKAIFSLALVMTLVTLVSGGVGMGFLYQAAFEEGRERLSAITQSQAHLIEAVAQFDALNKQHDHPQDATAAAISQIEDARSQFKGFGKSGTFLVGSREEGQIHFLLTQLSTGVKRIPPVPWNETMAEPMRRALQGKTGTMVGQDYSGEIVLAAYEPVAGLNLGIVAKIDLAEIRAPFIRAAAVAMGFTLFAICLGSLLFFKIANPILDKIRNQNESIGKSQQGLAKAQELAHLGNWDWDISKNEFSWSDEIYRIFGFSPQEFDANYEAFLQLVQIDDREMVAAAINQALEGGTNYQFEHRITRPDGSERFVHERGEVIFDEHGAPTRMVGTMQDITARKRMEEESKDREELLRSLLMSTGEAIYGIDLLGCCTFANAACVEVLGYRHVSNLVGKNIHELIHFAHEDGSTYPHTACKINQAVRKGKSAYVANEVFWRANGESFPVEYRSEPVIVEDDIVGAVISFSDITQRKTAEEKLLLSDRVFKNTSEAIIITNPDGSILDVNRAFTQITGYERHEVIDQNPSIMKSGRQDDDFYIKMWNTLLEQGCWTGEIWDLRKNGGEYPKWLTINAVTDKAGEVSHYIGIFTDATQAKQAEQQLEQMAFYDALTKLPNRALCKDRLKHEIKIAGRHETKLAVMYLDLDRFKYVNDTMGHACGDLLLVEAAHRIESCVREVDTVARVGGDEFTLILNDIENASAIERIAQSIIDELSNKFIIQENEVNIGASIGVSIYPENGKDFETLTKNADAAMYRAKEGGRNTYRFFTEELHIAMFRRVELDKQLRMAIEQNELSLHYQPKVNLRSGLIVGMEALLRWNNSKMGAVSPAEFIPIAEESGFIMPLGEFVLRKACAQNTAWINAGYNALRVAVNLSRRQFEQTDIVECIAAILVETGLKPQNLELEITETIVMQDEEKAVRTLSQLRKLGVHISIDDFGTGYSSLASLKRFPIQSLKIDRSFICDLTANPDGAAIVSAIISMANSLDLNVVAEGVETQAQMDFLRKDGCDELQGYLYSKPVPPKEFIELLKSEEMLQEARPVY